METDSRLYDAAVTGDVNVLQELLHQDQLILDRISPTHFNETPLHIASMRGHSEFVKEILNHTSQLTKELDSRKSTPLHIASAKGYSQIVKELLRVDPDMCFARDIDGRNPLHLAAIKDRMEALKLMIEIRPQAVFEKTNRGENILHLCVKYGQLEALKMVLEMVGDGNQLVHEKDVDGNTILHLAVLAKQIEIIKHLVTLNNFGLNEKNGRGKTAIDILSKSETDDAYFEMKNIIMKAGGLKANHLHSQKCCGLNLSYFNQQTGQTPAAEGGSNWLTKKRESIMVVASLIATMTFQAGLNPSGGVWQETKGKNIIAGKAVMALNHPEGYKNYIRFNTIAFICSMSTILLLISGLPLRHKFHLWFLMAIMWLTVTSSAITYLISIFVLTPKYSNYDIFRREVKFAIVVWCFVMGLVLLWNTGRLILLVQKRRGAIEAIWPPNKWRRSTKTLP